MRERALLPPMDGCGIAQVAFASLNVDFPGVRASPSRLHNVSLATRPLNPPRSLVNDSIASCERNKSLDYWCVSINSLISLSAVLAQACECGKAFDFALIGRMKKAPKVGQHET